MNLPSFDEFRQKAMAAGFDEVIEREWAPNTVLDTHTHAFGVHAILTRGEMWLTMHGQTQHLLPGSIFELDPNVPHDERYGAEGAAYWVAVKTLDLRSLALIYCCNVRSVARMTCVACGQTRRARLARNTYFKNKEVLWP